MNPLFVLAQLFLLPAFLLSPAMPYVQNGRGFDISYPQCDGQTPLPAGKSFGIIGVTGGRSFTENPCLGYEYLWSIENGRAPSVYLNLNEAAGSTVLYAFDGPLQCGQNYDVCRQYNYGFLAAKYAYNYARHEGVFSNVWWFDIELANSWDDDLSQNDLVLQGALDFFNNEARLDHSHVTVGMYSTRKQWQEIIGDDFRPVTSFESHLPLWTVGWYNRAVSSIFCANKFAFGGGTILLMQYTDGDLDNDFVCSNNSTSLQKK